MPGIFNDFFGNEWMQKSAPAAPAVNIIETEDAYKVEVAAPGLTKDDFEIKLDEDNQLVISMQKKEERTIGQPQGQQSLQGSKSGQEAGQRQMSEQSQSQSQGQGQSQHSEQGSGNMENEGMSGSSQSGQSSSMQSGQSGSQSQGQQMKKSDKAENGRYLRREFSYTQFQQRMILPDNVDKEDIQAKVENGVLTITIPKRQEQQEKESVKTIEVQ